MERLDTVNPERLAWSCRDRGIDVEGLSKATNIPPGVLQDALDGHPALTVAQLKKIAEFFDRGLLFFLEDGPVDEEAAHTPQFRTLARQKPEMSANLRALIDRVERQREVYLSLREDLDGSLPDPFRPPVTTGDPKSVAGHARKWLRLGATNNFDSYRAAVEARGMLVFRTNGYAGKWQISKNNPIVGFALFHDTCPVIVVKKLEFDAPQSFTLMHELGHVLLHKASSIDDERDLWANSGMEREANIFAAHLLVPDDFLRAIDDRSRPADASLFDAWLKPQRSAWGISSEVILLRLLEQRRIGQDDYLAYKDWRAANPPRQLDGGSRMYRHREPKHIFGDPFVRVVLDALSARQITLARASDYLDSLKIKDLHQLEQHYAGA